MEVFNLNIRPGKTCPVIHCSQFDKGRTFRANLHDGSEVFTLTGAETLSVIEKKSDGNMITIGVTNTSDSYVEFATTEQMTALAGPQICELRIVEGDTLIGSANFILDCEESPDTGIESESEIHNLETQIQDINEQIVPDMVAEEVENQYDSQNVIFDDTPTENHGTGYAVTSEGVKNALDGKPDNLSDLGDVDISSPTSNQALVYNPTTQKWENGEVSTVGSIDDLDDVDTTGKAEGDSLRYDGSEWVAQPTTVKLTLAEYNALTEKAPNTRYIITDAPALEYTADDLSYDGGTTTVKEKIDEKATAQEIDGVTLACQRCPIASISNSKAYASGKINYLSTVITFGSTGEASATYFQCSLFGASDFCFGNLYDNNNDKSYTITKGNSTSLWVFDGSTRVNANTFAGKSNMYLNLIGIKP